jgi:3-hydroxyacyl-CoA dehydrogenase/enoyl-CoA hydratase/3-hydroxybutyryl-CoA epimerase
VAAINGTALGGGYELCLACHHRIMVGDEKAMVGLPEVTLGLLPGSGGTQRLPRLIGIQPALQAIMEGKRYRPKDAKGQGMIDAVVDTQEELIPAAKKWILEEGNAIQPWDEKKFKIPGGGVQTKNSVMVFGGAAGLLLKKTYGNYPSAKAILNCVHEGLQLPIDKGLAVETSYFAKCVVSKEAKAMIRTLFYTLNAANKGVGRPDVPKMEINKIGILGAGMMGAGIAYVSARAGLDVVLKDVTLEGAEKGKAYSEKLLSKKLSRGWMSQEAYDAFMSKIKTTDNPNDISDCQVVIEAVFEDRGLKAIVTKESETVMAKNAVYASNTSTLPITGLAEAAERPENFIGLHFFSPVDKMPLVEIIVGEKTSDHAIAACIDYTLKIGKTPIVVNDGRGFYTSRVFSTYIFEGLELLAEGVVPALIENAGRMAGMPVGPLAISDEVSIELMYKIHKQTKKDTGIGYEGKAMDIVNQFMEDFDRPGKKAGKGFYDYPKGQKKHIWPELVKHYPSKEDQPEVEEVQKRLLYIQAIEATKAYEENIVTTPESADIGSIMGIGFPPFTGGIFSFIDGMGVARFVKECEALSKQYGKRFNPPEILETMAREGKSFY